VKKKEAFTIPDCMGASPAKPKPGEMSATYKRSVTGFKFPSPATGNLKLFFKWRFYYSNVILFNQPLPNPAIVNLQLFPITLFQLENENYW
jgi:hypothetical protein